MGGRQLPRQHINLFRQKSRLSLFLLLFFLFFCFFNPPHTFPLAIVWFLFFVPMNTACSDQSKELAFEGESATKERHLE